MSRTPKPDRSRVRIAPLLALALALTPLTACGDAGEEPLHIGVAGPVSQANGRSMARAVEMAVGEINAAGGIDGRPLELVVMDDSANTERAIEVAAELVADPRIIAVVGHINSSATLAAAEVYNQPENGLLAISPASSSPLITAAGPWTFRVCPSDLVHGPALADWTYSDLRRRRAAVVYANDAYGRGVLESFARAFENAGGSIISSDPYVSGIFDSPVAVEPYLVRAIRSGMDALMIAGQAEEGLRILEAARRLGYTGPVLGADGLTGLKDAGEIADGVYISSAFLPDRPEPRTQEFVRAYTDRFGELPDHRGAMAYDAVHLLARGLREVLPDVRQHSELAAGTSRELREALRDYIEGVGTESPAFDGVSGTIAFDPNGDVAGKEIAIGVVRDGRILTVQTADLDSIAAQDATTAAASGE